MKKLIVWALSVGMLALTGCPDKGNNNSTQATAYNPYYAACAGATYQNGGYYANYNGQLVNCQNQNTYGTYNVNNFNYNNGCQGLSHYNQPLYPVQIGNTIQCVSQHFLSGISYNAGFGNPYAGFSGYYNYGNYFSWGNNMYNQYYITDDASKKCNAGDVAVGAIAPGLISYMLGGSTAQNLAFAAAGGVLMASSEGCFD